MQLFAIAQETLQRLLRDRVFLPVIVVGILFMLFTTLASDWGILEFQKILTDFGTLSFHLTGILVTIFWGTKTLDESHHEGSIETQLAAPISRWTWLLGKYLGLCLTLSILALILWISLQLLHLAFSYGWLGTQLLVTLLFIYFTWLVVGAATFFFASASSGPTALFSSTSLWIAGLMAQPLYQSLSPNTPETTRQIVHFMATYWNLHTFNLSSYVFSADFPGFANLFDRFLAAVIYMVFFLTAACIMMRKKDIIA